MSQSSTHTLTRSQLSSDLSILRDLPYVTNLLTSPGSTNSSATVGQPKDAPTLLSTYTPSTATHDQSQALVKAYINQMQQVQQLRQRQNQDVASGGELGGRIDSLRERGQEVADVLSQVRV